MGNALPPLFSYHPASVVGSLVAGSPLGGVAREDAVPEPEQEKVSWSARVAALLGRRPAEAAPSA